ncbi:MAG: hypothetical protein WBW06_22055, partial [Xanthobacteraceae bacterium]
RRPALLMRRRVRQSSSAPVVHCDEREIIARNKRNGAHGLVGAFQKRLQCSRRSWRRRLPHRHILGDQSRRAPMVFWSSGEAE